MGEKWGFYKFPLDPDTRQPRIGAQLAWRAVGATVEPVAPGDTRYLGEDPRHVALGFDLALPLRWQLEEARHFLQVARAGLRRDKTVRMLTVSGCRHDWRIMLRLLDAMTQGVEPREAFAQLEAQCETPDEGGFDDLLQRARKLAAGRHRDVLLIPDR
jgi:hypothetical protein